MKDVIDSSVAFASAKKTSKRSRRETSCSPEGSVMPPLPDSPRQRRRRSAVITLHSPPHAGPLGLPQTRPGGRHLRAVHGPPAVFPQSAGGHHAGAPGHRDDRLWHHLWLSFRFDVVGTSRSASSDLWGARREARGADR